MASSKLPPGWVSTWICWRERSGWGWAEALGWFSINFRHKLWKTFLSTSGFNWLHHVGLCMVDVLRIALAIWMATWWHTVGCNNMEWTWTDYPRLYCVRLYEICANPILSLEILNSPYMEAQGPKMKWTPKPGSKPGVFVSGDSTVLAHEWATTVPNVVTTGLKMLESTSDGFLQDKGVIEFQKRKISGFEKVDK